MVQYGYYKGVKKIKRLKSAILIILGFMLIQGSAYAADDVRVYVNGMRLENDAILYNDSTYAPLRAVGEALGAQVSWDEASNSVFIAFSEDDAVAKIVADVSPSVVTIIGNYNRENEAYKYSNPIVHGSGVIYKSNGYIVTNAHVVKDITNLTVVLNDGTILPGNLLYSDENADLAVVKIDKIGLCPVTMADGKTILSGTTAIAIGTPISLSMRNTVTKGIISGCDVGLPDCYYKLIQTDASINPGNSGGPLLNARGELIGINTEKYVSMEIESMCFAIPVDTVKYVLNQFETYGYVVRPKLDFELSQSWEAKVGLPTQKGLTVKMSTNASIMTGDEIISVNSVPVHSIPDWNEAIKDTYNGESLKIEFIRNGAKKETELKEMLK